MYFWTKDTWFALAELAFSRVWPVVHSTYGPRARALYTRFGGVLAEGVTSKFSRALTVNYILPLSIVSYCFVCVVLTCSVSSVINSSEAFAHSAGRVRVNSRLRHDGFPKNREVN